MKFFTAEDFILHKDLWYSLSSIAETANAKLEREGKVVYRRNIGLCAEEWTQGKHDANTPTHKALLICIEEIVKCEHPANKVNILCRTWNDYGKLEGDREYICQCGVRVTPAKFEEVK